MSEEKELSEESSINELFEALILPDGGANVRPITLQQDELDTRMMILIRGKHETASYIMAQIMSAIQELFDLQEQEVAADTPRIIRA